MKEHLAAHEHSPDQAARAEVCAECEANRADLKVAVLSETTEDPAERLEELTAWVAEHLPECVPHALAAQVCLQIEQDEAAVGFPEFKVSDLPANELREEVQVFMAEKLAEQRNETARGQIADGVPAKVPVEVGQESALLTEETQLAATNDNLKSERLDEQQREAKMLEQHAEKTDRNVELRRLQTAFDQLRAEGADTTEALRQVIAQARHPETKQHLNAILGKIALLQTALPDKPELVSRLLNASGLNLAAATVAGSFAGFLEAAETEEALTDDDRQVLCHIIHREERYAKTGTDVQTELGQTLTNADGQIVLAHPENEPYQFRDHVHGFARPNGTQHLRAITNYGEQVTLEISGWSGADIGRASELLQLWAMTENEGQTGYLTSLTKLNWSDTAQIDAFALGRASQIVNAMLGGNEGYDGDILEGRDAIGIIRWQAQLANQSCAVLRGTRDETRTHDALIGLGIKDKKGNIDLDALRAFGEYSRDCWMTVPDYKRVKAFMSGHA